MTLIWPLEIEKSYLIFTFLHDHINLLANHILLISEYISDYVLSVSEYISNILDIYLHYHLSCLSQCNSSYFYTWQPVLSPTSLCTSCQECWLLCFYIFSNFPMPPKNWKKWNFPPQPYMPLHVQFLPTSLIFTDIISLLLTILHWIISFSISQTFKALSQMLCSYCYARIEFVPLAPF